MTRHLFLLRHGKSSWPDKVPDHERPLAPRGKTAVPLIARQLQSLVGDAAMDRIDLALVSSARRVQETFARLAGVIAGLSPVVEPAIYEARPGTLLALVQSLPSATRTVLMIGHNPGFHALAVYLASPGASDSDALERLERKLPTAGLVHLEFDGEWIKAGAEAARLAHFITPSMLGGIDED